MLSEVGPSGFPIHGVELLGLHAFIVSGSFCSIVEFFLSESQDLARLLDAQIEFLANGRNGAPVALWGYHFPHI